MVQVLTGENDFARSRALGARINTFVDVYGDMAVERLDAGEVDIARIRESLQSVPFLSEKKLVVLSSTILNKSVMEQAESLLSLVSETTEVIIVEPKLDKRSVYYKLLKRTTDLQEFTALDEVALARWLLQTVKGENGELSTANARLMVERIGTDQQLLSQELHKLLLYRPQIDRTSIELLSDAAPQSQIFDLVDAAFSGNVRRALELYRDQREQKTDPAQIIALMTWQLRALALVLTARQRTDSEIAQGAKISPYVIQKTRRLTAHLTLPRLKHLISDLLALDLRSKRESIDLDEALQNYILLLAS